MARTVAVVLNYRTPRLTVAAVRALEASDSPPADVVVVDNASGDDSLAIFEAGLRGTVVVAASTNGGFSAGCNLGIAEALRRGADRVFLVNSDVLVEPAAIGALEQALEVSPALGIVGPAVVSHGNPEVVQSLGIRYSPRTGRMRHLGLGANLRMSRGPAQRVVDGVSGCAMLVRREVFDAVGVLAEEYFFGFEDLDLCLRARRAGFSAACVGNAVVRHHEHATIGRRSWRRSYFATRNHLLLAKRFGAGNWLGYRVARAAAITGYSVAHVLLTSEVPRTQGLRGLVAGLRDHVRGRYGAAPD